MSHRHNQNNHEEKLVRDARIWELRTLNGWSQSQIARDVGLSQVAIHKILERQTKEYTKVYWDKIDNEKTSQIYALKRVAATMWDSWLKSCEPQKVIRQQGITDESPKGIKNIEIRQQHGDPKYVDLYLKALRDIREILGINAATETTATVTHHISGEDNNAALARFVDRLSAAATARGITTFN